MKITIRQTGESDGGFQAEVRFDGGTPNTIEVRDPFNDKEEARLAWYFQEWLKFPFTKEAVAREAAGSVTDYGQRLFEQVIKGNPDIYSEYKGGLDDGGYSKLFVEVEGEPAFHALHWEALKDPKEDRPLAVEAPFAPDNETAL